jgi:hypothetical protein
VDVHCPASRQRFHQPEWQGNAATCSQVAGRAAGRRSLRNIRVCMRILLIGLVSQRSQRVRDDWADGIPRETLRKLSAFPPEHHQWRNSLATFWLNVPSARQCAPTRWYGTSRWALGLACRMCGDCRWRCSLFSKRTMAGRAKAGAPVRRSNYELGKTRAQIEHKSFRGQ